MGTMRFLLLSLLMLATALAGCADDAKPAGNDGGGINVVATKDTGVIKGVVVDPAVRPIEGVTIILRGSEIEDQETKTNAQGAFGFQALTPGTYFLKATKLGFFESQQSTEVAAGVNDPPSVKILLEPNPGSIPYYTAHTWSGFIECSARVAVPGAASLGYNPCSGAAGSGNIGNQDAQFMVDALDATPSYIQSELIWDSTQSLGNGLSYVVGPPPEGTVCPDIKYTRADGTSPLLIQLPGDQLEAEGVGPEEGICFRVFSWVADESQGTAGVVTSQKFDSITHVFYNFVPDEGWRFTANGEPRVPT